MAQPITKSIIVNRPVAEVYRLWSNFENYPRFMNNIKAVTRTGDRSSHWVMTGPLGRNLEWDAIIIDMQENRRIAWRSSERTAESEVRTSGEVTFRSLAPSETEVHASILYEPHAKSGESLSKMFANPDEKLAEDLRKFKQFAEEGVSGNGQTSGIPHR